MKKYQAAIIINREIANKIFEMKLQFKILPALLPGQFVNLSVPGFFLRRPISICEQDPDQNTITLVYKVVGKGTKKLTTLDPDLQVDLLMPLGNGFQIKKMQEKNPKQIVIAGGGVGIPPLYFLAQELIEQGNVPNIVLGYANESEVFYLNKFEQLNTNIKVTTDDGSFAEQGNVTDSIKKYFPDADYIFTCGPRPMLQALTKLKIPAGQYSFEERMACGFGGCMGCSLKTNSELGYKRVCLEGPVFLKEEIIW